MLVQYFAMSFLSKMIYHPLKPEMTYLFIVRTIGGRGNLDVLSPFLDGYSALYCHILIREYAVDRLHYVRRYDAEFAF